MVYWTKEKSFYFVLAGQSIWFMLLAYVCSFLGALQVPALVIALSYSAAGFVYSWKSSEDANESSSETKNQSMLERCAHLWDSPIIKSTPNRQQVVASHPSAVQSISSPTTAFAPDDVIDPTAVLKTKLELNLKTAGAKSNQPPESAQEPKSQSAIYFRALFLACLITILYKQLIVLALSFIPVAIYLGKHLFVTFGIKEYLGTVITDLYALVQVSHSEMILMMSFRCVIELNSIELNFCLLFFFFCA